MDKYFMCTTLFEERVLILEMRSIVKSYRKGLLVFQNEQYTATVQHIRLFGDKFRKTFYSLSSTKTVYAK